MIGAVSESLRNLLEAEMQSSAKVTLLSPGDASSHQTRVNLFAYRVAPNPFLADRPPTPSPTVPGQLEPPPLALSVFYVLTGHAPLDAQTGLADAQTVMTEAMRVLHQHPVVPATALEEGLTEGDVRVTLASADLEELGRLWTALNQELRLSAIYEVACVEVPTTGVLEAGPPVERAEVEVVQVGR